MRTAPHDDLAFPALRSAGHLGLALATVAALVGGLLFELAPAHPVLAYGLAALGAFLALAAAALLVAARLELRVASAGLRARARGSA